MICWVRHLRCTAEYQVRGPWQASQLGTVRPNICQSASSAFRSMLQIHRFLLVNIEQCRISWLWLRRSKHSYSWSKVVELSSISRIAVLSFRLTDTSAWCKISFTVGKSKGIGKESRLAQEALAVREELRKRKLALYRHRRQKGKQAKDVLRRFRPPAPKPNKSKMEFAAFWNDFLFSDKRSFIPGATSIHRTSRAYYATPSLVFIYLRRASTIPSGPLASSTSRSALG